MDPDGLLQGQLLPLEDGNRRFKSCSAVMCPVVFCVCVAQCRYKLTMKQQPVH
jgi:hypothetical protein